MKLADYDNLERLAGCPTDYIASEFFRKNVKAFLPPAYLLAAKRISRKSRSDFINLWAWESSNLMEECSVAEDLGEVGEYSGGWGMRPQLTASSSALSEIYRSAFLRVLAWLHSAGRIDEATFLRDSLKTCPVDLSLWEIKTAPMPRWWPQLEASVKSKEGEQLLVDLLGWEKIAELRNLSVSQLRGHPAKILAAEGALIEPTESKEGGASSRFTLLGFGYRVTGPRRAAPEDVAGNLLWKPGWHCNPLGNNLLSIFDQTGSENLFPIVESHVFQDLEVVPLVARLNSMAVTTWQAFRGYDRPFGVAPALFTAGELLLSHDEASWFYILESSRVVVGFDWRMGTLERIAKNLYPKHGQVLEVDSELLHSVLERENLRLGYVLQIDVCVKKYDYEEGTTYSQARVLDVSELIL